METRIHTATNLYTYIKNARHMENLERQIASKEEELELLDQLEELHGKLGISSLFGTHAKYNSLKVEILKLQIAKNNVEREMLEFELGSFMED